MRGLTLDSSWKGVGPVSISRVSMMYLAVSESSALDSMRFTCSAPPMSISAP